MFLIRTFFLYACILYIHYTYPTIHHITNAKEFKKIVKKNKKPVLVKFGATWCSTCQHVAPSFEAISNDNEFKNVTFAEVDIVQAPDLSKKNNIIGVPTFKYVQNGTEKKQEIGVQELETFDTHLRDTLRSVFKITQNEYGPEKEKEFFADTSSQETTPEPQTTGKTNSKHGLLGILWSTLDWILCTVKALWYKLLNFFGF